MALPQDETDLPDEETDFADDKEEAELLDPRDRSEILGSSANRFNLADYEPCEDHEGEKFFQCAAKNLAKRLLGHYLYCHSSKIFVRILETEAYSNVNVDPINNPEAPDYVYDKMFGDGCRQFRVKAGVLIARTPTLEQPSEITPQMNAGLDHPLELYITAGKRPNIDDVVLIRSCEAIEGIAELEKRLHLDIHGCCAHTDSSKMAKNMLVGPEKVAKALLGSDPSDWATANPYLYRRGGIQLFLRKADPEDPEGLPSRLPERILIGPRVLSEKRVPYVKFNEHSKKSERYHAPHRLALATFKKYNYERIKELKTIDPDEQPVDDLDLINYETDSEDDDENFEDIDEGKDSDD